MARILVDGSSTAYGLWGGESGGWADRLKMSFLSVPDRRRYASIVNLAAPLRTVTEIAADFACNAKAYSGSSRTKIALFMLGMCESRRLESELAVAPAEFRRAVTELGSMCVAQGFTPIFLGMPPIDESRTQDFGRERASYTNADRDSYDGFVREYCFANKFAYVDIAAELARLFPDPAPIMDEDGLHMNGLGHAAIHDIVHPLILLRMQADVLARSSERDRSSVPA